MDLQKITNEEPLKKTWKNNNVTRRLDQIWVTKEWAKDIYNCKVLDNEDELLDTDHNIVIAKILSNNTLDKRTEAVNRRLGNKRRIFNFDLMNDQLWEEFQKQLDLNIGELHINYELSKNHGEIKDLNRTWSLIHQVLMKAAYKKILSELKKKHNKSNRPKLLLNTLSLAKYVVRVILKINRILKGKDEYEVID